MKKLNTIFLALAFSLSAFLFLSATLSSNFAYGSEILLQSPWNVCATLTYGNDKFVYNLSDYVTSADKSVVYSGKQEKYNIYKSLTKMQLPEKAIYNYIFSGFDNIVEHFAYVKKQKVDAKVDFDGKFTYTEGTDGVEVDEAKLFCLLSKNVGKRCVLRLPLKYEKAVTSEQLKAITVLKGKYTTSFSQSSANRCFNIQKCCNSLNGTIVQSGEKFSFNDIVGPRTEQNGYKNAVVINRGKYVEGVGGGVCQASTTLYNALLLANFIPTAHAHSLACSYVEPGFDSMVAYGSSDLSFVNYTDYPLYISAYVVNKTVTFCIYGVKNEYSVVRESKCERTPFVTDYVLDKTLPVGEEKVVCNGSDGVTAKAYLVYYDGEKQVKRWLVRNEVYKQVNKVVRYNPSEQENEQNPAF